MSSSIKKMLHHAETIAILGCSEKPYRTSHHIAQYLQQKGYKIIPVNPGHDKILGEKVYASLAEVPKDISIDIVDIFRNSKYAAEMVKQIVDFSERTGGQPVVWTQLDVSSDEAEEKARRAGLTYVKNKCIMVEHQRYT